MLPRLDGLWRLFPVEYKRGKPKRDACDENTMPRRNVRHPDSNGSVVLRTAPTPY
jgi:hypothetical protein